MEDIHRDLTIMNEIYCNNCGKAGHLYHQCKIPITSIGIIAFRIYQNKPQYLMIRRKDTLGHIDFMRGKYSTSNKYYIINMLNQMTVEEKDRLKTGDFDLLWRAIWGKNSISGQYKNEEATSREKYNMLIQGQGLGTKDQIPTQYSASSKIPPSTSYTLYDLIKESDANQIEWTEAEWGFPKGRRNQQEKDFECALREFSEETGYSTHTLKNMQNIIPYEEIFTGSNYKSYKHKYYLMYMDYQDTLAMDNFERSEVSKMEWKSHDQCLDCIRDYNVEKKRLIDRVHKTVSKYSMYFV